MAEDGYKVTLNAYDLSQGMARQLSSALLGKPIEALWHTGIVVYGTEYYFGGGIQSAPVGSTPYGNPIRVVDLGVTHIPKDVFEGYLEEISPRYTAETYSLMTHNCNNFSNEVAQFLVGATIPEYILNLPNEVMNSPMGPLLMPMIQQLEATLRANAVPQAPQFGPSAVAQSVQTASRSVNVEPVKQEVDAGIKPKTESTTTASPSSKEKENKTSDSNKVVNDPLGDSRSQVQEEITKEFAALMATGTLPASEAAAMATRRVMQKYGHMSSAQS